MFHTTIHPNRLVTIWPCHRGKFMVLSGGRVMVPGTDSEVIDAFEDVGEVIDSIMSMEVQK